MMKKKILLFLIAIIFIFSLAACNKREDKSVFEVSFDSMGGVGINRIAAETIESEPKPDKDGYVFEGWYIDEKFASARIIFPFTPQKDTTLYAKYIDVKAGNEELVFEPADDGKAYSVISYSGNSASVVIPAEHNGLPVKYAAVGFLKNSLYLERFYFYSALENIDETFHYCYSFEKFVKMDEGGQYSVIDGVLYDSYETELLCYPVAMENAEFTVPDSVITVNDNAFTNALYLKAIIFGKNVKNIPEHFRALASLERIECINNGNFYTDKGVLYSGDKKTLLAFPTASANKEYALIDEVVEVKEQAFEKSRIEQLIFNKNLEEFGAQMEMPALKRITVPEENENFFDDDGVLYTKFGQLIKYPAARESKSYVTHERATEIGAFSFSGTVNLKSLTVSQYVTTAASYAFGGVSGAAIERVVFAEGSRLRELGSGFFADCENKISLTVSSRIPPETEITEIGEHVKEILVPTNLVGLYEHEWTAAAEIISTADFAVENFTVTFDSAGGAEVDEISCAYLSAEPKPKRDGYVFEGWYTSEYGGGKRIEFPCAVVENMTLYAFWKGEEQE